MNSSNRLKLNDILIFYLGFIVMIISYRLYPYSITVALTSLAALIAFGVLAIINYLPYFLSKNRMKFENRINIFNGMIYLIFGILVLLFTYVFVMIMFFPEEDWEIVSIVYADSRFIIISFLSTIYCLILYIYSIKTNKENKIEYYKEAFSYVFFMSALVNLVIAITAKYKENLNIPLDILIISPFVIVLVIGILYYGVMIFNIFSNGKFYKWKNAIKIFVINLFKTRLGYYFGVSFSLLLGILYILASVSSNSIFYRYIGYMIFSIAILRIIDQVWLMLSRSKGDKIKFINQYIMIFVNSGILLLITFVARTGIISINIKDTGDLGIFAAIQLICIIIRIVTTVLGYYYTRINVKREPHFIALNNMSILSLLVSVFAFLITFLVNVGVGKYDLDNVIKIVSIVIFVLALVMITLMIIRGVIGLIKYLKSFKNSEA